MKSRSKLAKTIFIVVPIFVLAGLSLIAYSVINKQSNVSAVSATDFNAGNIISDSVFYNKDAMSAQQIQDFLNKLLPSCYPYGQTSVSGFNPPYVCLKDYYENPSTGENSFTKGSPGSFSGGISAAQIIYNAAQEYGINPQVLLVLLKKESLGPLTSDTWPVANQYKFAMGYACPDSGPDNTANCDSSKSGFYKQIRAAAWQLNYYKNHPNDYRYSIGWNDIQYSPNATCGTKRVYIENIATLSLYIYTPYTPNDAALANYPGTANCGAYGNRNFFMFFSEWFGDVHQDYKPAICDSKVSKVGCVWQLTDSKTGNKFLTLSDTERDASILSNNYSYDGIAFYAFKTQVEGTIPIYRLKLPNRHFYTASYSEVSSLASSPNNTYEGIAFYAYPSSNDNSSYSIYRLHGNDSHILTIDNSQKETSISEGYTYEGVAFNTPSGLELAAKPEVGRSNVYRINSSKEHHYTVSLSERDSLLRNGWNSEGMLYQSTTEVTSTPVYRLYNKEHLFTSSEQEKNSLVKSGWKYEGIAWYVDSRTPYIFRFYTNGEHFYTASLNEALSITNKGASSEGVAFGYNQESTNSVYRLYNGTNHFLTSNINEVIQITNNGWKYEGIAFKYSPQNLIPVYRLYNKEHFFTSSEQEKNSLVKSGWKYEGIAWYVPTSGSSVYRLLSKDGSYHFFTSSEQEKNSLVKSGWKYEGVAWYI